MGEISTIHTPLPSLAQPPLDQRDSEHQKKKHPRNGGGIAHLEPLEGVQIDVIHNGRCEARRPALCHHKNLSEDLETTDHSRDQHEEIHEGEHRPRDMPELVPDAGAINICCLIQLLGNPLQCGQIKQHVVAGQSPDLHDDQGGLGPHRARQPLRRLSQAKPPQHLVHNSKIRVVHPLPDHRCGNERAHCGKKEYRSEKTMPRIFRSTRSARKRETPIWNGIPNI